MNSGSQETLALAVLDYARNEGIRIERLSPTHALAVQQMFKSGTDHIANFLVWGKDAQKWNTKQVLFWIHDILNAPHPQETFIFFKGKRAVGMALFGPFHTGYGESVDKNHIQFTYWLGKDFLGKKLGDRIVRVLEYIAFEHRKYHAIHIIHDSNNHTTSHMASRLGYVFDNYFDGEVKARKEGGLYFSWVKINPSLLKYRNINVHTKKKSFVA